MNNWTIVKIEDVCEIIMGQSPSSDFYNSEGKGLPFFQGKAEFAEVHPVVQKWCSSPKRIAEKDNILLSVRAPVGPTNIANVKCCIGRGLAAIRYKLPECYKFLFYFLRCIEKSLAGQGMGSTFSAISGSVIRNQIFPLPPFAEQHRIVAKIEELFSDLDAGIESLRMAKDQLKIYRQSVLKWAFEGKLTEEWRKKNKPEPACELLKRIREEREIKYKEECEKAKREGNKAPRKLEELPTISEDELATLPKLPQGMKWTRFGTFGLIAEGPQNGLYKHQSAYGKGVLIVRIDNFYDGVIQPWSEMRRLQISKDETIIYGLKENDLLVNRVNSMSHLGKCGLVQNLIEPSVFESNMMRITLSKNAFVHKFITFYMSSRQGVLQLQKNAKQAVNQASINQQDVLNSFIPICSIEEQTQIVSEIESRLSVADNLEKTIDASLAQADALRQSILKRAFEGKLVPQDPNDLPAAELLKQIRAERTSALKARPEAKKRKGAFNEG